jgi:hypothetical protein
VASSFTKHICKLERSEPLDLIRQSEPSDAVGTAGGTGEQGWAAMVQWSMMGYAGAWGHGMHGDGHGGMRHEGMHGHGNGHGGMYGWTW